MNLQETAWGGGGGELAYKGLKYCGDLYSQAVTVNNIRKAFPTWQKG